ncbi:MAG: serine protein kinase RIO [Candidatus Micrarchaeia archaeon]
MAQRASTRKRPDREVKVVKPERKIETGVFDRHTLLVISRFIKRKVFDSLDYPISTGKEADVFHATTLDGRNLAVKIFRIETSTFRAMEDYLISDPRFKGISDNKFDIINAWTRKEFKNLQIMEAAGVHSPHPLICNANVLVMEFLGTGGMAYSTLFQTGSESPESDARSILEDIKKMYIAGLVHADISEYNIMMTDNGPYIIDAGQGVVVKHPKALEFLKRDIDNIARYFRKYKLALDTEEEYQKILKAGEEASKKERRIYSWELKEDEGDWEAEGGEAPESEDGKEKKGEG